MKLNCLACAVVISNNVKESTLIKVLTVVLYKLSILRLKVLLTLTQALMKHQVKHGLILVNALLLLLLRYIQTRVLIACLFFGLFYQ